MQMRLLSVATVAALLLAPAAFAGTATLTGQCAALEKQFDAAVIHHATASKYTTAKELRAEGGKLCASGKSSAGAMKLESALRDIGATPAS